jgi:fibronectin type 3 domain-containing protein
MIECQHNRTAAGARSKKAKYVRVVLHRVILTIVLLSLFATPVVAAQVTLAWDASGAQGVAGYKVYLGTQSKTYSSSVNAGTATSATIANLLVGTTYYFATTSLSATGQESTYSNEVSYKVPVSVCTYTISPTSQTIAASGGQGSVSVTTQSTCSWTASGNPSWIALSSTAAKTGTGTAEYTVETNIEQTSRSAAITVAGKIFAVNQAASTIKYYTITANAGTGGSIAPCGSVSVASGASKTFTITPASRHRINYLVIDGKRVSARTTYTFSGVQANRSIEAVFK